MEKASAAMERKQLQREEVEMKRSAGTAQRHGPEFTSRLQIATETL
ncbi:hypothetical protein GDO81_003400 [Engystomops pustulosus]|uniref:Uncharacterized protein n=1 Tax=Engystomops pustulosus TaxID=76066 RepID=A0AAV7A453_ENGPU|nr:hypothetical protein GDO81_003400 [Engystomops pustulosus]